MIITNINLYYNAMNKNLVSIVLITIITISILLFIYSWVSCNSNHIEIVVSRYNENLDWLSNEPFNRHPVIIYNKGENEDFTKTANIQSIIKIPNVGRESHTYLYHIIQNYDNLADITVFLPGSTGLSHKYTRAANLIKIVEYINDTYFYDKVDDLYQEYKDFQLDNYQSRDNTNKKINDEKILTPSMYRPFGVWYKHWFGDLKVSDTSYFGIFAVHKRHILQRPKEFYQELLNELSVSSNPEVGHYYERAWSAIFYQS